jgi:uncharacterized protein
MEEFRMRQYPTILQAIHLVVLYIFIQTVVDFPLALIDYYRDSDLLYNPVKKILLGVGSVMFILWYGFKRTGNPLKDVFPVRKFNLLVILLLFLFFAGIQQWLNVVNHYIELILPPPSWFLEMFDKIFENDFGFTGALMKVVIIAPVVEELIFRGVIMHGLMRNYSKGTAIFLSGLLFALFHLNPWQFPATFMLGLLLGWIMIRTHSILLCIIGHGINNLLVLLSITFDRQLSESFLSRLNTSSYLIISLFLVIFSVLLMFRVTTPKGKTLKTNL